MWNNKCPRCRKGDIFKQPFQINNLLDMNKKCENCELDLEPEPGFYFGSFMISYGITAWMLLLPALTLVFYFGWSGNQAMVFTIFLLAISFVKIVRGSRSLYLHFMARFAEGTWKEGHSSSNYDGTKFK